MAEVAHLIIYEKICSMINTNNQQTKKKGKKNYWANQDEWDSSPKRNITQGRKQWGVWINDLPPFT